MIVKEKVKYIIEALEKEYPYAQCSLRYMHDYELLISCRLSAQCTDARVNIVTKELFNKYKSLKEFAEADVKDIEQIIKPCGLFKTKAKSIREMSEQIINDFEGKLPDSIEKLTMLSGVGRKTANLIMGDVYHKPAIVTDTHCIRISGRLGLTKNKEPVKVEKDLVKIIPKEQSSDFCHRLVDLGRDYCKARSPLCNQCPIRKYFEENGEKLNCTI